MRTLRYAWEEAVTSLARGRWTLLLSVATIAVTIISLFLSGASPQEALRWANASGSLAISRRGPMEGTSTKAQIETFLNAQQ